MDGFYRTSTDSFIDFTIGVDIIMIRELGTKTSVAYMPIFRSIEDFSSCERRINAYG